MRSVANGGAAEVLFTLFHHGNMLDEKFSSDAAWFVVISKHSSR
jgi:hypothetical protein